MTTLSRLLTVRPWWPGRMVELVSHGVVETVTGRAGSRLAWAGSRLAWSGSRLAWAGSRLAWSARYLAWLTEAVVAGQGVDAVSAYRGLADMFRGLADLASFGRRWWFRQSLVVWAALFESAGRAAPQPCPGQHRSASNSRPATVALHLSASAPVGQQQSPCTFRPATTCRPLRSALEASPGDALHDPALEE
jgi:hypothetical protein